MRLQDFPIASWELFFFFKELFCKWMIREQVSWFRAGSNHMILRRFPAVSWDVSPDGNKNL